MKVTATSMATILVATLFSPFAVQAQPAPIHNPVVARMPCRVVSDRVVANGAHAPRPMRMRYDAGSAPQQAGARKAGYAVPSTDEPPRDIAAELRGACE